MRFAWLAVLVFGCGEDAMHHLADAPPADAMVDAGDPCRSPFDDDLKHGLASWTVTQTTPELFTVTADASGVHVAKTGTSPGGFQSVAITVPMLVEANSQDEIYAFSLAVDFANAVIGPAEDQIELHPIIGGDTFFAVYSNHGGSGREVHVWDGANVQASMPTTATGGTHEIVMTEQRALTASESGMPIYTGTSLQYLRGVELAVNLQPGSDDAVSVDFTNFRASWQCDVPL